ncbi:uncharacterized protein [Clytia hemisphaerica]|uniref:uncharacterized protein n=1 Tax=Clytia hemisphaerica TaxID=252671 RepID=UPI0034D42ED5
MDPMNLSGFVSRKTALGIAVTTESLIPNNSIRSIHLSSAGKNEADFKNLANDIFKEAEALECRSISIVAAEFKSVSRKRAAEIYLEALKKKNMGHLKLVLGAVFRDLDKILKSILLKGQKKRTIEQTEDS